LKGLDLAKVFRYKTSNRRREDFIGLNHTIGIDDKPAPVFNPSFLVVNTVCHSQLSTAIGKHGKRNTAGNHFRQFVVVPHLMDKNAVDTDGKDLGSKLLKIRIMIGDRRNFGRSNKCKVSRIEAENHPLAKII